MARIRSKMAKNQNSSAEQMVCSNSIGRNNLKDAIISELSSRSPSMSINPQLIHLRLQQFLPTFQTPTHPPYSSMIREALLKLNEERGSTKEDISRFLEREFEGLPWAHATFLTHHLEKLCGNGELLHVGNERYMVNLDDGSDVGKEDRALVQVEGDHVDSKRESIKDVGEESQIEASRNLEIVCIDNKGDMVCTDGGDLGNEEVEMSHRLLNISINDEKEDQDRALVPVKEVEVEAINGLGGVNGDQAAEPENQCEDEMHGMEVVEVNRRSEMHGEIDCADNERSMVHVDEVTEVVEVSRRSEMPGEIDCANIERPMVHVEEETSHHLSVSDRDEKEDQTLVLVKEREVEAINGLSGVKLNGDRAAESENQCDGTHSMEGSGQNKASEQRTDGSEEQNEGRTEALEEVQEESPKFSDQIEVAEEVGVAKESPKFSDQIEVAEEVDVAKGKLTKVARNHWGQKRKRKQKTKRQIKVLKGDIPEPMTEDEERSQKKKRGSGVEKSAGEEEQPQKMKRGSGVEKSAVEQEQPPKMMRGSGVKRSAGEQNRSQRMMREIEVNKSAGELERPKGMMPGSGVKISAGEQKLPLKMRLRSGVKKSASEQDQPRRGKMIGEQGRRSQDSEIDKKRVLPCDGEDVKRSKTSFLKRSMRLSENQKKEGLKHEEPRKRNLHDTGRGLFIVCALPATRPRTNMDAAKAHMPPTDSRSASPESSEWGNVLLRKLKRSTRRRRGNVSERFTQSELKPNGTSKNIDQLEGKQEQKPEKLGDNGIKRKKANSGSEEEAEESMDQGHQAKQLKVYARRNAVRKSQLKEAGNSNNLSSNSE